MFPNYLQYRKEDNYACINDEKSVAYVIKYFGNFKLSILIFVNILIANNFNLTKKQINVSTRNSYITSKVLEMRCGSFENIDNDIYESERVTYKLAKSLISKDTSLNKQIIKVIKYFDRLIGDIRFLKLLELSQRDMNIKTLDITDNLSTRSQKTGNTILFTDASAAIVPVNPKHLPSYIAGCQVANTRNGIFDREYTILTPAANLKTGIEFLERAKSDSEYKLRFYRVVQDTAIVNLLCEVLDPIGGTIAGAYATDRAEDYNREMADKCFSMDNMEKLNLEIYKQVAKSKGLDPNDVEGTGINRNFVPDSQKSDLCDKPDKNALVTWDDKKDEITKNDYQ